MLSPIPLTKREKLLLTQHVERLIEHYVNVTNMSRQMGISRGTIYNWLDDKGSHEGLLLCEAKLKEIGNV